MYCTDIHTHGLDNLSAGCCQTETVEELARRHLLSGTDRIVPTLFPGPIDRMRRQIKSIRNALNNNQNTSAKIVGVHLEGPFLNPEHAGALDPAHFLLPDTETLARLLEGFEDFVRIVTIAPELPGALPVIEELAARGIAASLGHSGATWAEADAARRAGAGGITHLFNAMRGIHHREPGLAGFGLTDPEIYVELIADGRHLSDWTLDLVFRIKPIDRIILVSDSVAAPPEAAGDPGVEGPDGRLQGGRYALPAVLPRLRRFGLGEREIRLVTDENAARYLGLPPRTA